MLIWLNGAFGAGKTTSAFELARRVSGAFVYDPENIGYFIRRNTPKSMNYADFQDDPLWRRFNALQLRRLAGEYKGLVVVPMTIINPDYYAELIEPLAAEFGARHFILRANRETLIKRLNKRLYGNWARERIDVCESVFEKGIPGESVDTNGRSVDWVVGEVARRAGLDLPPDKRGALQKAAERVIITMRHIRR